MNLTNKNKIFIRNLLASDIESCMRLFHDTIHKINKRDYSPDQLAVWAPETMKASDDRWQSLLEHISYVAEIDNTIVGFGDITKDGYVDRLYIHQDYQRMGIASRIIKKLEGQALQLNLNEMTTEASITAKSFFESFGFVVCKQQEKDVRGTKFINFIMKKRLK